MSVLANQTVTTKRNGATQVLDGRPLTIPELWNLVAGKHPVQATDDQQVLGRLEQSCRTVERAVTAQRRVYGITTGFGGMSDIAVSRQEAADSQHNLLNFLSAGVGNGIDPRHTRAAMALRANMLLRGKSGVRLEIIERLVKFLNANAIPEVKEFGSIGASGDLVPLAVIARAITGNGPSVRVRLGEEFVSSEFALRSLQLKPLELRPKESLAIVNGTSFSAGIAANACREATRLFCLSLGLQGMFLLAMDAHEEAFHEFVHQVKPHPGQVWTANIFRNFLHTGAHNGAAPQRRHVQDRYSIRCLPQYIGPIAESLAAIRKTIETEMNSVTDNPLIDSDRDCFYQGGNFLGQYIALRMDEMRSAIGLLAKHLDVQVAMLVAPEFNHGLPASLRGTQTPAYNMGLKGLQITANSIVPQLLHLAQPLVPHYPTHAEQFNQNVNGLSWGAANMAWQAVSLFRNYLATSMIFAVQACDLRAKARLGHFDGRGILSPSLVRLYESIATVLNAKHSKSSPLLAHDSDRCLETDLENLVAELEIDGIVTESLQLIMTEYETFSSEC